MILTTLIRWKRRCLSRRYIRGVGVEIGALHLPLWVSDAARVCYVDRFDEKLLRQHYPELDGRPLKVDRVDDGERLGTFAAASLDFIIANHMLEHCENPLGTIRNHLARLKPGGILYYAIPNRRFSFDKGRPLTTWDHLVSDDRSGIEKSRWDHYLEFATLVEKRAPGEEAKRYAKHLMDHAYSIHFHVWQTETFRQFLDHAQAYLTYGFTIEVFTRNVTEILAVLRKA